MNNTPQWYAVYVRSRSEKKAAKYLEDISGYTDVYHIEAYCPMVEYIRQWSDRKKKIETPLFTSYIFVRIATQKDYDKVLENPYVVKFIWFNGIPCAIPDTQIEAIRRYVNEYNGVDELPSRDDYRKGQLVRVINGPMKGLVGRLSEVDSKRLIVLIEGVGSYIPVNLSRAKVEHFEINNKED